MDIKSTAVCIQMISETHMKVWVGYEHEIQGQRSFGDLQEITEIHFDPNEECTSSSSLEDQIGRLAISLLAANWPNSVWLAKYSNQLRNTEQMALQKMQELARSGDLRSMNWLAVHWITRGLETGDTGTFAEGENLLAAAASRGHEPAKAFLNDSLPSIKILFEDRWNGKR